MKSAVSGLQEDWLDRYGADLDVSWIRRIRERYDPLDLPKGSTVEKIPQHLAQLPRFQSQHLEFSKPVVEIGKSEELGEFADWFEQALVDFIPWKKGPYRLFGEDIDAEWRSDWKWDRVASRMKRLEGKRIADIGSSNGYFMYRMAAHNPELVVGFEPFKKSWYNFQFLQRFAQQPNLHMELMGVEWIDAFKGFFDIVFCMGILYHHTDPVGILKKIYQAMNPPGQLIVECQGIAGDDSIALCPRGRYTNARSIWFLPTRSCLENWLKRAQFKNIECFFDEPLSFDEQRTTKWAPIKSLADYLDPEDSSRTVEGYPAPRRMYLRATK